MDNGLKEPLEFLVDCFRDNSHLALAEDCQENKTNLFLAEALPKLRDLLKLKYLCLSINSTQQRIINSYLGSETEFDMSALKIGQRIFGQKGHNLDGRINGNYFDLLRVAKSLGINVLGIRKDVENSKSTKETTPEEYHEHMANMIPNEGPTLVYAGNINIRKDIGIARYRPEVFSISVYKNPFNKPENRLTTLEKFLVKRFKGSLPKNGFGFDFKSDLGKELDDYEKGLEIPSQHRYSEWHDCVLVI